MLRVKDRFGFLVSSMIYCVVLFPRFNNSIIELGVRIDFSLASKFHEAFRFFLYIQYLP